MEIYKYENFIQRAENVRDDEEQVTISVDEIKGGIYYMSDGQELTKENLLGAYEKIETGFGLFKSDNFSGEGVDYSLKNDIEKLNKNGGIDIVESTDEVGSFDFNKNPFDEANPIPQTQHSAPYVEPFRGDVIFEAFKKMNVKDNLFDLGEVILTLPDSSQILTFNQLFNVDKEKSIEYVKAILDIPENVETLKLQIAQLIINKLG